MCLKSVLQLWRGGGKMLVVYLHGSIVTALHMNSSLAFLKPRHGQFERVALQAQGAPDLVCHAVHVRRLIVDSQQMILQLILGICNFLNARLQFGVDLFSKNKRDAFSKETRLPSGRMLLTLLGLPHATLIARLSLNRTQKIIWKEKTASQEERREQGRDLVEAGPHVVGAGSQQRFDVVAQLQRQLSLLLGSGDVGFGEANPGHRFRDGVVLLSLEEKNWLQKNFFGILKFMLFTKRLSCRTCKIFWHETSKK